jgi:hypothetical protein
VRKKYYHNSMMEMLQYGMVFILDLDGEGVFDFEFAIIHSLNIVSYFILICADLTIECVCVPSVLY